MRSLVASASLLLLVGCAPDPPSEARVETIAGLDLSEPTHFPRGVIASLKDVYSNPVPNQMVALEEGAHLWLYGFAADSMFRPPPSSPLRCETTDVYGEVEVDCHATGRDDRGEWTYNLWFTPARGGGGFSAYLHPPR